MPSAGPASSDSPVSGGDFPRPASGGQAPSGDGAAPRRLLRLIDALCSAQAPVPLAALAASAGLSKPTAHRLLRVLTGEGWAVAHEGGNYSIGPAVRALGAAITGSGSRDSIERVIVELQKEVRQTVHVGVRSGDRIIYTHKVEGDQPFAMASRVGMYQPLHSTAIGKCILSGLDAGALDALVGRAGLGRRTDATITTRAALDEELARVREGGFALDEEENEANVRCIAVPLHTTGRQVAGAVSISTVTFVVAREEVLALRGALTRTAHRLEPLFGS
ncbi:IclR family transcriptional regulator [Streptomyces sp. WMMB 322]|uniref:IclR family transcriptional regulator n=1 Tax=Streptomyces sp. WMMB 322 TaxID=1286821 RepID=UPI0006E28EAC|nr:IclR family transcriptional regulator [Streptomyces sp. WMMB 322]SCK45644.1 transcriptional regulator, IclR family [Streptomyces sp. WMMB 322]